MVWLYAFFVVFIMAPAASAFQQSAATQEQVHHVTQLRNAGRLDDALEVLAKLLGEAERHESGAAPLAVVLHGIGVINADLARYPDAERAFRRAIRVQEAAGGRNELTTQVIKLDLGAVYLDWGRHDDAKAIFLELRREWEQTIPGSQQLAAVLDSLGCIESVRKHFAEAEALLRRSVQIMEGRRDVNPTRMAIALGDLGGVLFVTRRYSEAIGYGERAERILEGRGAVIDSPLLNMWSLLASAYSITGRPEEAEFYARRSVSAAQAVYGADSLRAGRAMAIASQVLQRVGKKADAKSMRKRSEQILADVSRGDPGRLTVDVNALR